jgi:hypothetical protein
VNPGDLLAMHTEIVRLATAVEQLRAAGIKAHPALLRVTDEHLRQAERALRDAAEGLIDPIGRTTVTEYITNS